VLLLFGSWFLLVLLVRVCIFLSSPRLLLVFSTDRVCFRYCFTSM